VRDQILLYVAGGLPVILTLAILYQRAKILVLRQLVTSTTESNVRLGDEVKKTNDRMREIEEREANFLKRPVVVYAGPGSVESIAAQLAPAVVAAVIAEIRRDAELYKHRPN